MRTKPIRSYRYYLEDVTHCTWPGVLPWRSQTSRKGYRTFQKAAARRDVILKHYAAKYGNGGPDLRISA